jgi:hypothetical protein
MRLKITTTNAANALSETTALLLLTKIKRPRQQPQTEIQPALLHQKINTGFGCSSTPQYCSLPWGATRSKPAGVLKNAPVFFFFKTHIPSEKQL